jgi:hypothetical protein
MAVNWNLGGGNNALQMFGVGAQMGQNLVDRREAREDRNALLQMRQQEMDARAAERAQAQQRQQQEQRRADLPLMERLLTMSQDESSYQQARQVAGQYGIDVSGLPPTFDPTWRDQQLQTVKLLNTPQGQEALSTAGKIAADEGYRPGTPEFGARVNQIWQAESTKFLATQPGGGVASIVPGQRAQFVIQPNDGSQPAGAPASGVPALPPGFVLDEGGPGGSPSGAGFRP